MPRNDEGEFELVLGNRQLLSGFFIVVVLFGVFFTMGYIVGRHSAPPPISAASTVEPAPSRAPSSTSPEPGQASVVPAEQKKSETPPADNSNPAGTRPATAPPEAPRRVEPVRVEGGVTEPTPGIYLQVAAPRRTAAEGVIESLKNQGKTAVLAPGPNEETVRVLVGPLDKTDVGKVKAELEAAGFRPFVKNY